MNTPDCMVALTLALAKMKSPTRNIAAAPLK